MGERRLVYSGAAEADLDRLAAFLASKSPTAAARAIARLHKGASLLSAFPEMGVSVGRGFRQIILRNGKSGYVVRYRVYTDLILITRIWHGKEDWKDNP